MDEGKKMGAAVFCGLLAHLEEPKQVNFLE
jgi:hypothetical protein